MINRNNYEIWFLDFAEGRLSEKQVGLLMAFLENNDDLKSELKEIELIRLPVDDTLVFKDKNKLKQPVVVGMTSDDDLLIGAMENDLSDAQLANLNERLNNESILRKQQKHYQLTQLVPDLAVKYPNKSQLKRKDNLPIPLRMIWSIAAALLLLVGLVFVLRNGSQPTTTELPIVITDDQPTKQSNQPEIEIKESPKVEDMVKLKVEQTIVQKTDIQEFIPKKPKQIKVNTFQDVPEVETPVVIQEPAPVPNVPQMKSPPKPILEPELPEAKPVIAHKSPESETPKKKTEEPIGKNTRLFALNKPKELLIDAVDHQVKRLVKQSDKQERLTVPEAIISSVGAVTKTKTSYKKKNTDDAKRLSVSFGRFKFSRIKHKTR